MPWFNIRMTSQQGYTIVEIRRSYDRLISTMVYDLIPTMICPISCHTLSSVGRPYVAQSGATAKFLTEWSTSTLFQLHFRFRNGNGIEKFVCSLFRCRTNFTHTPWMRTVCPCYTTNLNVNTKNSLKNMLVKCFQQDRGHVLLLHNVNPSIYL